jgi:hypothetical protein
MSPARPPRRSQTDAATSRACVCPVAADVLIQGTRVGNRATELAGWSCQKHLHVEPFTRTMGVPRRPREHSVRSPTDQAIHRLARDGLCARARTRQDVAPRDSCHRETHQSVSVTHRRSPPGIYVLTTTIDSAVHEHLSDFGVVAILDRPTTASACRRPCHRCGGRLHHRFHRRLHPLRRFRRHHRIERLEPAKREGGTTASERAGRTSI